MSVCVGWPGRAATVTVTMDSRTYRCGDSVRLCVSVSCSVCVRRNTVDCESEAKNLSEVLLAVRSVLLLVER